MYCHFYRRLNPRYKKVSGIPKGTGYGSTKQDAKEEAARQAFYSLGWAPPAVRGKYHLSHAIFLDLKKRRVLALIMLVAAVFGTGLFRFSDFLVYSHTIHPTSRCPPTK